MALQTFHIRRSVLVLREQASLSGRLGPHLPPMECRHSHPVVFSFVDRLCGTLRSARLLSKADRQVDFVGPTFVLINLVLVSGLIPFGYMSHSFVADHFFYLPMAGVALIIPRALEKLFQKLGVESSSGKLVMVTLYLWIAVLGVASVRQTWLWRGPLSMWEATLTANPTSFAANNNLGLLLMARGDYDRALELFRKASKLAPGLDVPYFNMGEVRRLTGDSAEAKKMYAKTIWINPGHINARVMLSEMLWKQEQKDEAIEFLKKSMKRNPRSGKLHSELGLFYYFQGKEEDALKEFTSAIELDPFLPVPYIQKGVILLSRRLPDEAIPLLRDRVEPRPSC